ncbi:hypothetical protein niasHT_033934 [Heterodera trifolii]|uniref:Lon proteolytic domain-containing protein n=1 Tax=Heterodera trifolii TaxID=157864 RepID=A0ABD2HWJ3_9BILA
MVVAEVNGVGVGVISKKGKIIRIRVEAVVSQRKHALLIYGNVDPVLKEAIRYAFSSVKRVYESRRSGHFFEQNKVNLSIPPPSTKRSGPSASAAAALAILSLATGRPVQAGVCVTGKVTKTGRIIKIGDMKAKTIAAEEAKMVKMAFPRANLSESTLLDSTLRREQQEKLKNEAIVAVHELSEALVDHLNQSWVSHADNLQKRLDVKCKKSEAQSAALARRGTRTHGWHWSETLHRRHTPAKVVGDVDNWSRAIEADVTPMFRNFGTRLLDPWRRWRRTGVGRGRQHFDFTNGKKQKPTMKRRRTGCLMPTICRNGWMSSAKSRRFKARCWHGTRTHGWHWSETLHRRHTPAKVVGDVDNWSRAIEADVTPMFRNFGRTNERMKRRRTVTVFTSFGQFFGFVPFCHLASDANALLDWHSVSQREKAKCSSSSSSGFVQFLFLFLSNVSLAAVCANGKVSYKTPQILTTFS